jgi:hypothetical protein
MAEQREAALAGCEKKAPGSVISSEARKLSLKKPAKERFLVASLLGMTHKMSFSADC